MGARGWGGIELRMRALFCPLVLTRHVRNSVVYVTSEARKLPSSPKRAFGPGRPEPKERLFRRVRRSAGPGRPQVERDLRILEGAGTRVDA